MNLQIPPYIKGEALYGFVARIHYLSSTRSWKETNMLLFDKPSVRLNPALPAHIDTLAAVAHLAPIELLLHATSYPIVALTLPHDAQQRLASMMRGDSGGRIASISRTTSSRLTSIRLIKACPDCIKEDEEHFGSPVWRTKHQIYGVTACPVHKCQLTSQRSGEGGFNKQLCLPFGEDKVATSASPKQCYLSEFAVNLYDYLTFASPLQPPSFYYLKWLHKLRYATSKGRLHWKSLKHDMMDWWSGVFADQEPNLPLTLKGLEFVPALVHDSHSVHYIKHVLLMAFITSSVHSFFNPNFGPDASFKRSVNTSNKSDTQLYNDLKAGKSLRESANTHHRSVGYVKQFALRNNLPVSSKSKVINEEVARAIWRKAFYGFHRRAIAKELGVSVGSVETIIQSHWGLSNWRKHLRRVESLRKHRKLIIQFLAKNPKSTRGEILKSVKASYLWLYKHDHDWLYSQLPDRSDRRYHTSVDWGKRDMIISKILLDKTETFNSLSEVDRSVGGHGWLLREQERLPNSTKVAKSLLK